MSQFTQQLPSNIWQKVWRWLILMLLPLSSGVGLYFLRTPESAHLTEFSGLISLGAIGLWRWSWWLCQVLRSRIYLYWVFPRWRRRANQIPNEALPPVCILVPTYQEESWITERIFRVLAQEAQTLIHPLTLLVTSSSPQENAHIRRVLQSVDPHLKQIRLIEMVQTGEGKRKAMAEGLRKLASLGLPENTIVALMDGDSELTPGTLKRCLPFFNLFPKMGALTTDELPLVKGSYLFSEWFHLRFAQRHYQMCSVSLSQKVMCLTGRFSLFRAEAALHPTFADILETDTLDDWLWGRFKFLSGDDKSTWYWLLRHSYDMIYVPDVIVYSVETISGSVFDRAYQNMRRWYGNMLRNSDRAIALGPNKAGWFMWYCLIDQRISFWTSLITPGALLIFLFQQQWLAIGLVSCWIGLSRPVMLMVIFWGRQSYLKLVHIPIFLATQWTACIVKIWTQMNLAQQRWKNRGNQSISAAGTGWIKVMRLGTSRFLYAVQLFCFGVALCWLANLVNPWHDAADLWWHVQSSPPLQADDVVEAAAFGVIANDDKDDAQALQTLIETLPTDRTVKIKLPAGVINLQHPITLHRGNLTLAGQGTRRTVLRTDLSHWPKTYILAAKPQAAEVMLSSTAQNSMPLPWLTHINLEQFTLRVTTDDAWVQPIDSVRLEQVRQSNLSRLNIEQSSGDALVLQNTDDIQVEYTLLSNRDTLVSTLVSQTLHAAEQELRLPIAVSQR